MQASLAGGFEQVIVKIDGAIDTVRIEGAQTRTAISKEGKLIREKIEQTMPSSGELLGCFSSNLQY